MGFASVEQVLQRGEITKHQGYVIEKHEDNSITNIITFGGWPNPQLVPFLLNLPAKLGRKVLPLIQRTLLSGHVLLEGMYY